MNNPITNNENNNSQINRIRLLKKKIIVKELILKYRQQKNLTRQLYIEQRLNLKALSNRIAIQNLEMLTNMLAIQMTDPNSYFPGCDATAIPVIPDKERTLILKKITEQINLLK
ncbi:MAG: hypothetical protein WAU21_12805 [Chitinophagales bacterium]|nr:hypothetical protein [Bacteroidota bacterium]